jgi:hypothetical protein
MATLAIYRETTGGLARRLLLRIAISDYPLFVESLHFAVQDGPAGFFLQVTTDLRAVAVRRRV